MASAGPPSGMDDLVTDLEKLAATLPSPQPPAPSPPQSGNSQGLSFSVAGIGLGNTSSIASTTDRWDSSAVEGQLVPMMPSELEDSTLSLDFGGLESPDVPLPSNGENAEERGRLLVHYAGGSITFLLQIAVVAWSVRQLRRVLARRRLMRQGQVVSEARINSMPFRPVDLPLYSMLSPRAVRKLVELDNVAFLLIDVRHPDAVRATPFPLDNVINIPETELRACLQFVENVWDSRFPAAKQPARTDILVFISSKGQRAQRAATVAAELGFNGCCVLAGGIQSYFSEAENTYINLLGRDAVAFLMQEPSYQSKDEPSIKRLFIDVRRYDERALYGHIPGSSHIPVEDWPKALAMEPSDWESNHHLPKIGKNDIVILYSRTCRRAIWVAQLCSDAGITRCYVYKQGAYGWRLDPTVLPYDTYEQGDAPPEPLKFEVETCNREAAEIELRQKGFLVMIQAPAPGDT